MNGLGRLPLPRDDRDFRAAEILPVASTRTVRYWRRPLVLDQGDTGTCEGQAWTGWLADAPVTHPDILALKNPTDGEVYARQLYLDATGDTSLEQGAYTRQILKVLRTRALIGSYYRASSVDEVITCILEKGPVCFGSNWFVSMDRVVEEYGNAYIRVDESSGVRGGHEYLLDGVNLHPVEGPPFVRLHNSWGPDYGHLGTVRVSIEDLRLLFAGDAFICSEIGATK